MKQITLTCVYKYPMHACNIAMHVNGLSYDHISGSHIQTLHSDLLGNVY